MYRGDAYDYELGIVPKKVADKKKYFMLRRV